MVRRYWQKPEHQRFSVVLPHAESIPGAIWMLKASLLHADSQWAACPSCACWTLCARGCTAQPPPWGLWKGSSGHCINHSGREAWLITYPQLSCQNRTVHLCTPASPPPLVKHNQVLLGALPRVVLAPTQGRPRWAQEPLLTATGFSSVNFLHQWSSR